MLGGLEKDGQDCAVKDAIIANDGLLVVICGLFAFLSFGVLHETRFCMGYGGKLGRKGLEDRLPGTGFA